MRGPWASALGRSRERPGRAWAGTPVLACRRRCRMCRTQRAGPTRWRECWPAVNSKYRPRHIVESAQESASGKVGFGLPHLRRSGLTRPPPAASARESCAVLRAPGNWGLAGMDEAAPEHSFPPSLQFRASQPTPLPRMPQGSSEIPQVLQPLFHNLQLLSVRARLIVLHQALQDKSDQFFETGEIPGVTLLDSLAQLLAQTDAAPLFRHPVSPSATSAANPRRPRKVSTT